MSRNRTGEITDMKILVLDNYDSFTYNLVQMLDNLGFHERDVIRNDAIEVERVEEYDKILLSPGPSLPRDAGIMLPLIERYAPSKSILGVCLGHQGIGEVFNSPLRNLEAVQHGVATTIIREPEESLYRDTPSQFTVGRYHSWVIAEESVSSELVVTARDERGVIMGVRHQEYDLHGVQFHPESILTEYGYRLLFNWLGISESSLDEQGKEFLAKKIIEGNRR